MIAATLVIGVGVTYIAGRSSLKLPSGEARQVAVILGGRGAVGIVIASVALSSGIITGLGYSLIIVTTLVMSPRRAVVIGKKEGQSAISHR